LVPLALPIPVALVAGGEERQASVRAALDRVEPGVELVLVHDGVRPFVPRRDLEAVVAAARRYGAATLALPVRETIKRAGAGAPTPLVVETIPRHDLWAALTPQAFHRDLLARAHGAADRKVATDDATLVERLGHPVAIVPGWPGNLKVTRPEDLALAEALLARGGCP
jgi:2-C-methyl-D-erythritol 4-phosphate cytidylyltransferase